ncbi:MAG TPA: S41 family peptidase [Candidatus Gastranaerophilales bacterium]|nr:S41 family peptidase [Candidatus Gastranaerophilales bacterium]
MNTKNFTKIILLTCFLLFCAKSAFAGNPQETYDQVWKLINSKYVDVNQNGQDWHRWRHKYDSVVRTPEDSYVAIETMLSSLDDPYTRFLDPEEFAEESRSISGTLYGIGVQIGLREDKLVVISPIEDTPAAKAGLQANDIILEIQGESAKGISIKKAADQIRGPKGTKVTLLIKREDKEIKFEIMRDKIDVKSVSIKNPKNSKLDNNIGYIRLNSFLSHTASKEIEDAINALKDKDGYILDLRSNPGGLLSNAIYISDMFLDSGFIVSTVDRDGYKETQQANSDFVTKKPLVVLIDEGSASASEILSGALKDNGRAVLVGTKSFGKGLVQEINKLPDGAGINITTQKYLTPNGTDINKVGIIPDIEVKNEKEDIENKNDLQLKKAEQILKNLISYGKKAKNEPKVINSELPIKIIIEK